MSVFPVHDHHCPICGATFDCFDPDCQATRTYECNDCFRKEREEHEEGL